MTAYRVVKIARDVDVAYRKTISRMIAETLERQYTIDYRHIEKQADYVDTKRRKG